MKIVRIFAKQLFAFQYNNEKMNELERLLSLWNDTAYLYEFVNDRSHTKKEMQKINSCRDYLEDNSVFDADSFYEFLNEQQ